MMVLPAVRAGVEAARRDPMVGTGLAVLAAGQAPSGALVASPGLPVYRYAWLRDGTFCALALAMTGHTDPARAFHRWVARTLLGLRRQAEAAVQAARQGQPDPPHLPTRYCLGGEPEAHPDRAWRNFQLDGYGTWLAGVSRFAGRTGPPDDVLDAVRLVGRYLAAMWRVPCFDCWEERDRGHHTSTLLAVAAGLSAAARLVREPTFDQEAERICQTLVDRHVADGRLVKSWTDGRLDDRVDASLLWAGAPFRLAGVTGTAVQARTVEEVRSALLVPGGGVRRYLGDSYYGGGEWLPTTSWLGWHAVLAGDRPLAEHCDAWVRAHATADGLLPEQVTARAQFPVFVGPWTRRRGPVATPLLWSHAMQAVHAAAMVEAGWSPAV